MVNADNLFGVPVQEVPLTDWSVSNYADVFLPPAQSPLSAPRQGPVGNKPLRRECDLCRSARAVP